MIKDSISHETNKPEIKSFCDSFILKRDFITEIEEQNLVTEVEPHLKRQVYEKDHWDDVRFILISTAIITS